MKLDKVKKVTFKLYEIATENEVTILSGNKKSLDEMTKDFEGMHVFITDGTPSQEKIIRESGKSIKYEATTIIKMGNKTINSISEVSDNIKNELDSVIVDGDFSDIGNAIGVAIGKYHNKLGYDIDVLINGLKHGISISDGTHNQSKSRKIYDEPLPGEKNEKTEVVIYENINELKNIVFETIDNNELTNSEKSSIFIDSINKLRDNILKNIDNE